MYKADRELMSQVAQVKTKAEHIRRAAEVCKADMRLSCSDLTLLVNACVEAAEFRREHSKLHAEKYEVMAEQLSELSDKLDKSIELKAKYFASRESKKQCS